MDQRARALTMSLRRTNSPEACQEDEGPIPGQPRPVLRHPLRRPDRGALLLATTLLLPALSLTSCGRGGTEPDNLPPAVSIASPARNSDIRDSSGFDIEAEAEDPDGRVVSVILRLDGEYVAELTGPPFVFKMVPGDYFYGPHRITVTAVDDRHATARAESEFTFRYTYQVPPQDPDGLETADVAEVGMDRGPLEELVDLVADGTYPNIHAVLVYKDGRLAFEQYFAGQKYLYSTIDSVVSEYTEFDRFTRHRLSSVTKSFTSALLGIALSKGLVGSADDPVADYLPRQAGFFADGKEGIRMRDLAGMCSGLDWNEMSFPTVLDARSDLMKIAQSPNPLAYLFSKPLVAEPGTTFNYNSWLYITLGDILRRQTGMWAGDFAREYLFGPMGVTDFEWTSGLGFAETSGGLYLRARDLLKFGILYLNHGNWKGTQVVPASWVAESTAIHLPFEFSDVDGYGMGWWTRTYQVRTGSGSSRPMTSIHGGGWGGQYIIVLPGENMVVALNAGNYSTPGAEQPTLRMMTHHILAAVNR